MKKQIPPSKLAISPTTIRNLRAPELRHAVGGLTLIGGCSRQEVAPQDPDNVVLVVIVPLL